MSNPYVMSGIAVLVGIVIGFMICQQMKTKEETTEGFWDGTFVDSTGINVLIWIIIIVVSITIIGSMMGFKAGTSGQFSRDNFYPLK